MNDTVESIFNVDGETISVLATNYLMMQSLNDEIKWLQGEYRNLSMTMRSNYMSFKMTDDDLTLRIQLAKLFLVNIRQQRQLQDLYENVAVDSGKIIQTFQETSDDRQILSNSIFNTIRK